MRASEINLLQFIRRAPQFVIPIYQRHYSWGKVQWEQLWEDVLYAGQNEAIDTHFIGPVVYIANNVAMVAHPEALSVIDGQQRLATSTLFIAALEQHFDEHSLAEIHNFSARRLRNYYLVNPEEEGSERYYKLILSPDDKDTLLALLGHRLMPQNAISLLQNGFRFFKEKIQQNSENLESICRGLAKLSIVEVALDRAHDKPQLIFESMNSTGLDLSQADLIRNYILMDLEQNEQEKLYKNFWRPVERYFGQEAYITHFDPFMRHYLTVKIGDIPNKRDVYTTFKRYVQNARNNGLTTQNLVADIYDYAAYYRAVALVANENESKNLKRAFNDLRELNVDVAYPFLLEVYREYHNGLINADQVINIVRLVESYVFRRSICGLPTNTHSKVFAGLSRTLNQNQNQYLESVQAAFLLLQSYRRFPSDEEFKRQLKERDLYNFPRRSYWLRRLENHEQNEPISDGVYTIEHIMPQNKNLSPEWQKELGVEWQRIQQTWLHTLGNLTLTGYNSNYKDRPFREKRDCTDQNGNPIGLAASKIRLNIGLGQVQRWDEAAIQERATRLANKAVEVWRFPSLSQDVLEAYRPQPTQLNPDYSIDDFPQLANGGATATLFKALRKEIMDLDSCVNEEYLYRSRYIAYRAETNFVDVVPRNQCLDLFLNMFFQDIEDSRNLCEDVTSKGHNGNGDVKIRLSSQQDIPYVMGLIRQSFERQIGNAAD